MGKTLTIFDAPDGRVIAVNRKRLAEMPYFLLTNPPNNSVAIAANQASLQSVMTLSGEGPAQITAFAAQRTGACLVMLQMQDGMTMRGLMNGAVHIDTIFGNTAGAPLPGFQPFYLPEALYIDELRSLVVTFTDLSGAANAVRLNMLSSRYLPLLVSPDIEAVRQRLEEKQYVSMPYFYTLDQGDVTLAASATGQFPITVGQDHHFQIYKMMAISDAAFDINIVDTSTGESIIDSPNDGNFPISSNLIMGNANFPFIFHQPRLVQVGQRLLVTLVNRDTLNPNRIFLTLGGRALADRMWR